MTNFHEIVSNIDEGKQTLNLPLHTCAVLIWTAQVYNSSFRTCMDSTSIWTCMDIYVRIRIAQVYNSSFRACMDSTGIWTYMGIYVRIKTAQVYNSSFRACFPSSILSTISWKS